MRTRAVHVSKEPYDVYVGRGKDPKTGHRMSGSLWGNPFPLAEHGPLECMRRYFAYLRANPLLVQRARRELKGKRLGCWCKPELCHGDVLAALAEGRQLDELEAEWKAAIAPTLNLFQETP